MAVSVSIVEDDDQLRVGLQTILDGTPGFVCHQAYSSAERAVDGLMRQPVDVVLMDISLKGKDGIWCISELSKQTFPGQILALSVMDDDEIVFRAIQAGAAGYLLKDSPPLEVLNAIQEVHAGGSPMTASIARRVIQHFREIKKNQETSGLDLSVLTSREMEILEFIMKGHKYSEIAKQLGITLNTVKVHARNIFEKLHVSSRSELMAAAGRFSSQ